MLLQYVIVFVRDMKRSTAFYRDVVGIPLRFESPGWTEFATEGATLALHSSAETTSPVEVQGRMPPGRSRPGFAVPNLDEFHRRMVEQKVVCVREPTETFGVRIAEYSDPDGLSFSVSQARRGP